MTGANIVNNNHWIQCSEEELPNTFCEEPDSKYVGWIGYVYITTTYICDHNIEATIKNR